MKKVVKPSGEYNVIDLILIDHKFLKECIAVLTDESADEKKKHFTAKGFLDVLEKHSAAEKKTIYAKLLDVEDLHIPILEAKIEHGLADQKVKLLKAKVASSRVLNEETIAELKVLAELVQHHAREEETDLLPKMQKEIEHDELMELGSQFLKIRKYAEDQLKDRPNLNTELEGWKTSAKNLSQKFTNKMDQYLSSMRPGI